MDVQKNLMLVGDIRFTWEFQIDKFEESPIIIPEIVIGDSLRIIRGLSLHLSVQGKGEKPENKNFVVFRIRKYFDATLGNYCEESEPPIRICTCILNVVDAEGHEKFPRTITFDYIVYRDSKHSDAYEERYIERNCILNDASEYLQVDTLTVKVEGTLEEWDEYNYYVWPLIPQWCPSKSIFHLNVKQLEHDLEVYLPENSIHAGFLMGHSTFFHDVWDASMLKSAERYLPLRKEEVPAFMCMLIFIETEKLVLYEATISDLYKIADKYGIPVLLEKCRKCIENYLPRNRQDILNFATCYYDTELKRAAESHAERHSYETQDRDDSLEMGKDIDDDFVCDTHPISSNLIKTEADFREYLKNLWGKCRSEITHEVFHFIPAFERLEEPELYDFYQ